MHLNKKILKKKMAPAPIIESFVLYYSQDKEIDINDIIEDLNAPVDLIKWIYQFICLPRDIDEKIQERIAVKNSSQVYNGSEVVDSVFVLNSDSVKESKYISNSKQIENSVFVVNSQVVKDSIDVYDSKYVFQSKEILESLNITNCNNIRESNFVVDSSNIFKGNNINHSSHLLNCSNVFNSCFCNRVNNSKNCLFCCDLNEKEYYLFNSPISEQIYKVIFEQYQKIMNKQLVLFEQPRELDIPKRTRTISSLFKNFSKEEWQWVETLPNYDKDLMAYLTLQKYFII